MRIPLELALPENYGVADILAFHGRDSEQVSERCAFVASELKAQSSQTSQNSFEKAMFWGGYPACLGIQFRGHTAAVVLAVDISLEEDICAKKFELWQHELQIIVQRMLGLNQDVAAFLQLFSAHPDIGALILRRANLRVPLSASPFEALCWAVTGQQISVSAAVSIRRRFIQLLGTVHSGGLCCHPSPPQVAASEVALLRGIGLSKTKAQTLILLAQAIESGELALPANSDQPLNHASADALRAQLLSIRGIGPWTVNYVLLRGFAYLDGSLHGDVAVRRSLKILLGREEEISERQAQQWLTEFSPWRALVAAHLWAMHSDAVY